ncbi:CTP-dependent riboflavin kinase [Natrinema caseinilyticum]|uniref:CTP-dependent riboflavin kinase n=1 Tax=Natrinema caseinilyticum TaxID=2961570 RepID=UPI0020C1F0A5|nr:CTP-dependent riboflavin kinase [Natrinema caseinilyticum]
MSRPDQEVILGGTVEEGEGKAREFISLSGYMDQFKEELSYEPYPGTLNISLEAESVEDRKRIQRWEPITIDGWETDGGSFGPVFCLPATVSTEMQSDTYEQTHIIYPDRTDHDLSTVELLAPVRLREQLSLSNGDQVMIEAQKR